MSRLSPRALSATPMTSVTLKSPFVLRTVTPPLDAAARKNRPSPSAASASASCSAFDDELFLVIHLMIAGRLRWRDRRRRRSGSAARCGLASFDFPHGTLLLTEASSKKRASIHVVRGEEALAALDPGGLEPLESTLGRVRRARSRARTTRSSARSPIRTSSAASATPTPTRSSTRAKLSPLQADDAR